MAKFIPGLKLSKLYYKKEVKPILDKEFPRLIYSAGLFGWGSEVFGYDTEISRDHHWGPRVLLFLHQADYQRLKDKISKKLSENLPYTFMGYSTNFSDPDKDKVRHFIDIDSGSVNHMIQIFTIKSFWESRLGFNPSQNITTVDWLTSPQQRLLEIVSGEVFFDGLKKLEKMRKKFTYYPKDVWLYILASQWTKISQEEAFVGRTGHVGDELGSQVIACRIVREIMKLCFLMEKKYYPYSKWFGTAFNKLKIAKRVSPMLRKVLLSKSWKEREKELSKAYKIIVTAHNSLRITKPLSTKTVKYHSRPYLVIGADNFASAIKKAIKDPKIKKIKTNIGSIDQFTDSTDVTENRKICQQLGLLHRG